MKTYYVRVREVHVSTVAIFADSPEQAVASVEEGMGDEIMCEYSHTLESDHWTVECVKE